MSQEWLPHGSTFSEPEPEPEPELDLDPVPELDPEPEPEPEPEPTDLEQKADAITAAIYEDLLREALAPPTAGLSEGNQPPTSEAAEAEKVEAITQSIMGELVREAVVDVVPQAAAPTVGQSLDESGTLSDFGVDYTESFDDLQ